MQHLRALSNKFLAQLLGLVLSSDNINSPCNL